MAAAVQLPHSFAPTDLKNFKMAPIWPVLGMGLPPGNTFLTMKKAAFDFDYLCIWKRQ
jgi:hypothetical protein